MTAVDENGDTALTVAKSPSMLRLLKGEWVREIRVGDRSYMYNRYPVIFSKCSRFLLYSKLHVIYTYSFSS